MRLIDADKALYMEFEEMMQHLEHGCDYDVDKVVEQLQEMYEYCGTSNCADCKYDGKCEPELVFDIVKAGGVNG